MLKASFVKHQLCFKRPAGTSRGIYTTRDSWILQLWDSEDPAHIAYGECAPLPDLSCEFDEFYEAKVIEVCVRIDDFFYWLDDGLVNYPSIRFGLETALIDFQHKTNRILFDTPFTQGHEGILTNGLIWMGEPDAMRVQIQDKINQGFHCIKLKIGAHAIEEELSILEEIRKDFPKEKIELRVDANGAFNPEDALAILERLAVLDVHSIEQPIRQGQWRDMRYLCRKSPVPIALDEELIGVNTLEEKMMLLKNIKPQYLILKPSLHGGISGCEEWIDLAKAKKIGWWITSALESNIGLNAIAQWAASLEVDMPQGLGTGQLFTNNIPSPLELRGDRLFYKSDKAWDLSVLINE